MNRARRPPLQHPLVPVFDRAVDSLGVALSSDTTRHYRGTARNFLSYLGADHPEVQRLDQLRRELHILGWMSRLHSQTPALATASYINLLIALRGICNELAWTEQLPELAHLIRREDIPRLPQRLPRPLTAEQDKLLQQDGREWHRPVEFISVTPTRGRFLTAWRLTNKGAGRSRLKPRTTSGAFLLRVGTPRGEVPGHHCCLDRRTNSGSLAIFAAMRLASSRVSRFAAARRPGASS